jgi:hypothetical protein
LDVMKLFACVVALLQDERPFVSAKKVMMEMGEPYKSGVELLSFHTVSKVSHGSRVTCTPHPVWQSS